MNTAKIYHDSEGNECTIYQAVKREPGCIIQWYEQELEKAKEAGQQSKQWISVDDRLPKHGKGSFLACWKNQGNLMLVCFVNIHGNYILANSNGDDVCGSGDNPKFSHWMPLPAPPEEATNVE